MPFIAPLFEATGIPLASVMPFSFQYNGTCSSDFLSNWKVEHSAAKTTWLDPKTGLKVELHIRQFDDFPALEWLLYFENTSSANTPIIENIQALDISIFDPIAGKASDGNAPYVLHATNGAPSNPTDFEPRVCPIGINHTETLKAIGGRSSNGDFPFFKVQTGAGSLTFAIGWSGQWDANISCDCTRNLRVQSGIEKTHFTLHSGERVRMPRILMMNWKGDHLEASAQFRQLIYKHYSAVRDGKKMLPLPFCNTCFTRGGGWLNECDAENQISLIRAYAPLGLEALLTDAGWFEGGWPNGAGNWTPRKDAYPNGMAPVAKAAKDNHMIYGLWFEPERVVKGTTLENMHPDWVLHRKDGDDDTYLLNFGIPAARDYFFNIVRELMDLEGFRVYRQDFNIDPLPFWRYTDAPDRQGITEIRYIEGLYEYWDRIAERWPDSFREECASGGRRIDLETIMRLHAHQKSDYWFDNEVDQASTWGFSQFVPNNIISIPVCRLDDYSFHSAMASSLVLGWIADAPDFDTKRAKALLARYLEVRHLMIGGWYPLLPYSLDPKAWIASQYDRADLGEGMLLVFRRAESPDDRQTLTLHNLEGGANYQLTYVIAGEIKTMTGKEMMDGITVSLPQKQSTEMIRYKKQ